MSYENLTFSNKAKLLKELSTKLQSLELDMASTKAKSLKVKVNKERYDSLLVAYNNIKGVISGIENGAISKDKCKEILLAAYTQSEVSTSKSTESSFKVSLYNGENEEREAGVDTLVVDDDDTKVKNQLANLRTYRKNIPTSIKGVYSISKAPIIPLWNNFNLNNNKALNDAGFKTIHFSGDDLSGYVVLAEQTILLLDYDKYNKRHIESSKEEYEEDMQNYKMKVALLKKKYAEALKEYETNLKAYDKNQEKVEYNNELQRVHERDLTLFKAKKGPKPDKPKLKRVALLTYPMHPDANPMFKEKPVMPKKPVNFDKDSLSDVVTDILEQLSQNSSAKYVLMSDKYIKNPNSKATTDITKNPGTGIVCFWIAEKWKVANLERKFNRVKVNDWNFAFN